MYSLADKELAFKTYYDMPKKSIGGLCAILKNKLPNITEMVLAAWKEEDKWDERVKHYDAEFLENIWSRELKLTNKQQDNLETLLNKANDPTTDYSVQDMIGINRAVNEHRTSLLKRIAYDREVNSRSSENVNSSEISSKLEQIRKDMQSVGLSGVTFSSKNDILDTGE